MFDFAWSEMAVIAGVALVLIGPKDLPVAIRSITGMIKKARRMAGEFQTHVDEMLREANLDEVKNTFNEIRNFDLKSEMERHVDPDGSLRGTFADNPLEPAVLPTPSEAAGDVTSEAAPDAEALALEAASGDSATVADAPTAACTRPAFMPPSATPPAMPTPAPDDAVEPPAFVPPEVARATRARHANAGGR